MKHSSAVQSSIFLDPLHIGSSDQSVVSGPVACPRLHLHIQLLVLAIEFLGSNYSLGNDPLTRVLSVGDFLEVRGVESLSEEALDGVSSLGSLVFHVASLYFALHDKLDKRVVGEGGKEIGCVGPLLGIEFQQFGESERKNFVAVEVLGKLAKMDRHEGGVEAGICVILGSVNPGADLQETEAEGKHVIFVLTEVEVFSLEKVLVDLRTEKQFFFIFDLLISLLLPLVDFKISHEQKLEPFFLLENLLWRKSEEGQIPRLKLVQQRKSLEKEVDHVCLS